MWEWFYAEQLLPYSKWSVSGSKQSRCYIIQGGVWEWFYAEQLLPYSRRSVRVVLRRAAVTLFKAECDSGSTQSSCYLIQGRVWEWFYAEQLDDLFSYHLFCRNITHSRCISLTWLKKNSWKRDRIRINRIGTFTTKYRRFYLMLSLLSFLNQFRGFDNSFI